MREEHRRVEMAKQIHDPFGLTAQDIYEMREHRRVELAKPIHKQFGMTAESGLRNLGNLEPS